MDIDIFRIFTFYHRKCSTKKPNLKKSIVWVVDFVSRGHTLCGKKLPFMRRHRVFYIFFVYKLGSPIVPTAVAFSVTRYQSSAEYRGNYLVQIQV